MPAPGCATPPWHSRASRPAKARRPHGRSATGMAAGGGVRAQQVRPGPQALRQPACRRRQAGDPDGARRLHPAPGRHQRVGGALRTTSWPATPPTRACTSTPRGTRCTGIPPSTSCPNPWTHVDAVSESLAPRVRPSMTSVLHRYRVLASPSGAGASGRMRALRRLPRRPALARGRAFACTLIHPVAGAINPFTASERHARVHPGQRQFPRPVPAAHRRQRAGPAATNSGMARARSGAGGRPLHAGDTINVMAPRGRFFVPLEPDARRHHVGIAGGSGITPILSIMKTVLARDRTAASAWCTATAACSPPCSRRSYRI
ncbi:MAG: phenylacetic acid degradation protein [Ramlibacter sp.]|nr:phenylacetic acid degradation protein [Ramlibacter sp.]